MSRWRRILYVSVIAQILALVGFSFVYPFLPLFIQTLGVHGAAVPVWAGVIGFSTSLPMALVAPVWGTLADRYGRKPMVVRAMASGVLTIGLLIVAPNVWFVLALRFMQGILTGSVSASQALVASVTPREKMGFSMGLMQSAVLVGGAVGPLVGGFLDDHLGFRGAFAVAACMLALATLLVVFFVDEAFVPPAVHGSARRPNPFSDLRRIATPVLMAMAAVLFMVQFASIVPAPLLPLFVRHLSGVPRVHGHLQTSTSVGIILAVEGIVGALAAWQAQRVSNRVGYRRLLVGAVALAGICYVPAFFAHTVWQLVVVRAAVGASMGLALPSATAMVGLITPENRRASAFGLTSSASSFGFAAGPLVGGALGATFGFRPVFLVTAGLLMAVAVLVACVTREPEGVGDVTHALTATALKSNRGASLSQGRK